MRKFLRYVMDNYLRSRGRERLKERPLVTLETQQGYIYYRKASVVLYYLKEMIGEDAVNRALRKVIKQYAYTPPPYPTSWALVNAFSEETPSQLHYFDEGPLRKYYPLLEPHLGCHGKKAPGWQVGGDDQHRDA
jgi:hypothetical protein